MKILRIKDSFLECRIEDAIYFSDDRVALLAGSPKQGYKVKKWTNFEELERKDPEAWAAIYENFKVSEANFVLTAGGSSYGGAGFIALYDKSKKEYCWVLHLNECNNFVSVSIENEIITAISDYSFPNGVEFKLSIKSPELIQISCL